MKKKFYIIILSFLSLANAQEGSYISANLGYANIANWWKGSAAFTLNSGYALNKYFATEGGFTWIYPITNQYSINNSLSGSYIENQSFLDIAAKGSLPFSNIFNIYAKIGLGIGFASNTAIKYNGWSAPSGVSPGLYMALGGELSLSQFLDLIGEDYGLIPFAGSNYGNINAVGFGLKYKF